MVFDICPFLSQFIYFPYNDDFETFPVSSVDRPLVSFLASSVRFLIIIPPPPRIRSMGRRFIVFRLSVMPCFRDSVIILRFSSISWLRNDLGPNFADLLILTTSWLGMLRVNFLKFIIELWPLVDVGISFPLNFLRANWWNWTIFCICIDIDKTLA